MTCAMSKLASTTGSGADGGSTAYALSITGGNGTASGLFDAQTGSSVVLVLNGNTVEGHVGTSGGLLAFTLSLDDFVITLFSSGPGSITFPVKIYGMVKRGVDMQINAASTVLIVITLAATLIAMKMQAPNKAEH